MESVKGSSTSSTSSTPRQAPLPSTTTKNRGIFNAVTNAVTNAVKDAAEAQFQWAGRQVANGAIQSIRPQNQAPGGAPPSILPSWAQGVIEFLQNPSEGLEKIEIRLLYFGLSELVKECTKQEVASKKILKEAAKREAETANHGLTDEIIDLHESTVRKAPSSLNDLRRCIHIADGALDPENGEADFKEARDQIIEIMQKHPIWVHSLFQIPLPATETTIVNAIDIMDELRKLTRALGKNNSLPEMGAKFDYKTGIETEVKKLSVISSFMGVYKTIFSYFLNSKEIPPPEFQTIMEKIGIKEDAAIKDADLENIRKFFLKEIDEQIDKREDVFCVKRWILQYSLKTLLLGCETITDRLIQGVMKYLDGTISDVKSSTTGAVSNTPIEIIEKVAEGLTEWKLITAKKSVQIKKKDGNEFIGGEEFLRGHKSFVDLCFQFGDTAVDELMIKLKPTIRCESALKWLGKLSEVDSFPLKITISVVISPFRALFWTVNTFLLKPCEWVGNKILKGVSKYILRETHFIEGLTLKIKETLFPDPEKKQTEITDVMDVVVLGLLEKLRKQLNDPPDPSHKFQQIPVDETTNKALVECILALFENLHVRTLNKIQLCSYLQGQFNFIENVKQAIINPATDLIINGVVDVLNRSYQILLRKEMLNQQFYSLLRVSVKSMLLKGRKLSKEELVLKGKARKERRQLISQHINGLIWESVNIATVKVMTVGDPDAPIRKHGQELKRRLLDGKLIENWRTLIRDSCGSIVIDDALIQTNNGIHQQLCEVYAYMEEGIATMDQERKVGALSLGQYNEGIMQVIQCFKKFQENHLVVHYYYLRNTLSEDVVVALSEIRENSKSLKEKLDHFLEEGDIFSLEEDLTRIDELSAILSNTLSLPGYLKEFLAVLSAERSTYSTHIGKLKKYITLVTVIENFSTMSDSRQLPIDLKEPPEIVGALDTFKNSSGRESDFTAFKVALNFIKEKATAEVTGLSELANGGLVRMGEVAAKHVEDIKQAKRIKLDPREFLAHAEFGIMDALGKLKKQVEELEEVASIDIRPIEQNSVVKRIQQMIYDKLSENVNKLVELYTREGAPFQALLSQIYLHFLEAHGIDLHKLLTKSLR